MILILQQGPMWTDQIQAWAALIGIPATVVGIIVLLIRDKHKDDQIKKLSDIANHLSKMVADSERRYIVSKKPQIKITSGYEKKSKQIYLAFVNSNPNTTINGYGAFINNYEKPLLISPVQDTNGIQRLDLNIPVDEIPTSVNLMMEYYTTEGFTYKQRITLTPDQFGTVATFSHPLSYESE